jgi:hypothetical protein
MPRSEEDSDDRPLRRPSRQRIDDDEEDDRPRRRRREEDEEEEERPRRRRVAPASRSRRKQVGRSNFDKVVLGFFGLVIVGIIVAFGVFLLKNKSDPTNKPIEIANSDKYKTRPVAPPQPGSVIPQAPTNPEITLSNVRYDRLRAGSGIIFDYQFVTFREPGANYYAVTIVPGQGASAVDLPLFPRNQDTLELTTFGGKLPAGTTLYIAKGNRPILGGLQGPPPPPVSNLVTLP